MPHQATIYIVDDDPGVTEAISQLLRPTGADVETFPRADAFLKSYRPLGPGCLILDVRMPGMSGLELHARLVQGGNTLPVIIVTGHADVKMAVDSMKAGVLYFLEKPFRPQELFDEVQKAIRGDEELWRRRDEEKSIDGKLAALKPGEREVLDLIARGKTNDEIAGQLDMSVRGVEARRAKAMHKLGAESRSELLELLRAPGLSSSDAGLGQAGSVAHP